MLRVIKGEFAKRVMLFFFENEGQRSKAVTFKLFKEEGKHRYVLYKILNRYLSTNTASYKKLPGRVATVTTSKVLRKIEAAFSNNPLASVASVAKSLNLRKELFRNLRRRLLGI